MNFARRVWDHLALNCAPRLRGWPWNRWITAIARDRLVTSLLASSMGLGGASLGFTQPAAPVTVTEAIAVTSIDANDGAPMADATPNAAHGLTIEELESLALRNHPSIQRARSLAHAARGRALQAGLPFNPNVGFDGQQLASDGRAEQYGITLGQEIIARDKLSLSRATILHEVRQLEQELLMAQQRVLNEVRTNFYRVLRAQQQIDANRQLVALSEQGVAIADALFKAQEVGRIDNLQATIEVESAQIQLANAENRYRAAWRQLAASCGEPLLTEQPLAGDLYALHQSFDFDQELVRLQQQSPELHALVASIERARTNYCRQQIEMRPNVNVQGLFNWRDNGTDGDPNGALAVSLPLPIRNQNQGAIQDARYQIYAAEQALSERDLALRQRLAAAFERYNNAKQQVVRYRDVILPKAEESLELVRKSYEAGENSFLLLLTSQRTYIQSRLAYLESLELLRTAEIEIQGLLL